MFEPFHIRIIESIKEWFRNKFKKQSKEIDLKLVDPERLHQKPQDKAESKHYRKYKKIFLYGQSGGTNLIKEQKKYEARGKRIKHWRLVLSHSDFSQDEYIPIFYNKNKGHKGKGNKSSQKRSRRSL